MADPGEVLPGMWRQNYPVRIRWASPRNCSQTTNGGGWSRTRNGSSPIGRRRIINSPTVPESRERSEEHTSELQSHSDLHSFPTRRSSDLLSNYEWWRLEPHPEGVEPHWTTENYQLPYCAGIPGELRIVFVPPMWASPKITYLEPDVSYQASFFDPRIGTRTPIGEVRADVQRAWQAPITPTFEQWVIILEKKA